MKKVDVDRAKPLEQAAMVSDPRVIAKSGRPKAQRIILTENSEAVIEKKARLDKVKGRRGTI